MAKDLEKLLCAIPYGKENAIHNEELAKNFGVSPSKIKHLVREARARGIPIVSGSCGYWKTNDRNELQAFASSMERHAKMRFKSIKALKHSLSGVEGQISLSEPYGKPCGSRDGEHE